MCKCDPLIQNFLIPGTCYWEKLHRAAIMKTPKKHPIFQNGCCSDVSVKLRLVLLGNHCLHLPTILCRLQNLFQGQMGASYFHVANTDSILIIFTPSRCEKGNTREKMFHVVGLTTTWRPGVKLDLIF